MYDLDMTWLEDPLRWYDDVEPLKQLKLNARIPLASGEHETTRWGARRLIETGAIDIMHSIATPTQASPSGAKSPPWPV